MTVRNKISVLLSVLMIAVFAVACTGGETDKANKSVDEANKSVDEGNTAFKDANTKNDNMLSAEAKLNEDSSESDIQSVKTTAKDVVAAFEKAGKSYGDASKKFEEASKFNVQDKFKEYLQAKSQEFKKRSELCDSAKGYGQAMIDSKGPGEFREKVKTVESKIEAINKEIKDLEAKGKKIEDENKDIFKK